MISDYPKRRREKFLPEEDLQLKELVTKYGSNAWEIISSKMPGRNPRQCRERWKHYLSSDRGKAPWTQEEDRLLYEKMEEFGPKWTKIASFFQDRTDIQVKTRWMQRFASYSNLHLKNRNNRRPPIACHPFQPIAVAPLNPHFGQALGPSFGAVWQPCPIQICENGYKAPPSIVATAAVSPPARNAAPSPEAPFTLYQAHDFSIGSQSFWEVYSNNY
ncbi:Myb-like DNA-binding domain containing protein [Tritrichomonas foetus]|uniref:Myb-like DNA-binding domain containing protein n=1 Tax=Tritrichomonas foetus TaxID=1144522 RepID=A0A1J4JFJ4_9EUKA|nr:Myb-like DNA-binding domain containing protein [Tritrichomonas foetus]|eukprot:OHS95996.1 Myb-like DNA-binding domain containing protein [Tritrichomonas foetus]